MKSLTKTSAINSMRALQAASKRLFQHVHHNQNTTKAISTSYFSTQTEHGNVEELYERNDQLNVKITVTKSSSLASPDGNSINHNSHGSQVQTSSSSTSSSTTSIHNDTIPTPFVQTNDATKLVDSLLEYTSTLVQPSAMNVVAFSGGVDSSLVASLVHQVYQSQTISSENNSNLNGDVMNGRPTSLKDQPMQTSFTSITPTNTTFNDGTSSTSSSSDPIPPIHLQKKGQALAVIGISPSLSPRQLDLARSVADQIGIPLKEVATEEGKDETYIANEGQACLVCKTNLYSALEAVAKSTKSMMEEHQNRVNRSLTIDDMNLDHADSGKSQCQDQHHAQHQNSSRHTAILYNGTNADDTQDPTRLGLIAAANFSVQSPLIHTPKASVRLAAKHLNLPNWNYAASPCLRSRLALGMEATRDHLIAVDKAEERVRGVLGKIGMDETVNMRVRMLSGKRAMVELDPTWVISRKLDIDGSSIPSLVNDATEEAELERMRSMEERIHYLSLQLREEGVEQFCKDLGFVGGMGVRPFKSGSVSRR